MDSWLFLWPFFQTVSSLVCPQVWRGAMWGMFPPLWLFFMFFTCWCISQEGACNGRWMFSPASVLWPQSWKTSWSREGNISSCKHCFTHTVAIKMTAKRNYQLLKNIWKYFTNKCRHINKCEMINLNLTYFSPIWSQSSFLLLYSGDLLGRIYNKEFTLLKWFEPICTKMFSFSALITLSPAQSSSHHR